MPTAGRLTACGDCDLLQRVGALPPGFTALRALRRVAPYPQAAQHRAHLGAARRGGDLLRAGLVAYQIVVSEQMPAIATFTLMHGFPYSTYLLLAVGVAVNLVVAKLEQAGRSAAGNRFDLSYRWAFPLLFVGLNTLNALYFLAFH